MKTKGICYDITWSKWKAYIQVADQRYWLGNFQTEQEAIDARLFAEKQAKLGILENGRYGNINFVLTAVKKIAENSLEYQEAYEKALTALILTVLDFEKYNSEYLNTAICKSIIAYKGNANQKINEKFVSLIKGTDFEKWVAGDSIRKINRDNGNATVSVNEEFYEKIKELRKELLYGKQH